MAANWIEPRCVKESAAYTGLPVATLYRLARLGEISHHWEGRQLRFFTADLDAFLTRLTTVTETDRATL